MRIPGRNYIIAGFMSLASCMPGLAQNGVKQAEKQIVHSGLQHAVEGGFAGPFAGTFDNTVFYFGKHFLKQNSKTLLDGFGGMNINTTTGKPGLVGIGLVSHKIFPNINFWTRGTASVSKGAATYRQEVAFLPGINVGKNLNFKLGAHGAMTWDINNRQLERPKFGAMFQAMYSFKHGTGYLEFLRTGKSSEFIASYMMPL